MSSHRTASTAGWVSIFVNIFLFGLKYWAGIVTGSVAIIVDAWHTLSDSFSSIIVLLGIKISRKPADANHPFGHGRADLIASLIIGVILGVIAVNFLVESIERLVNKESVHYGTIALIAIITSIVFKEFLAQYSFWASKKTGSKSLRADAWHHRSDAISSIIILTGFFLDDYFWWIDGALGILVTMTLFYATYEILSDSISRILGDKPDDKLMSDIRDICNQYSNNPLYPHHFHVHHYGRHTELTLHIKISGEKTLDHAHDIASKIEDAIRNELGIEATIHMEPL